MEDTKFFNIPISGDYEVRVEYNVDFVILHLPYVNKFTPGVYKDMVVRLEQFWEFSHTVGYKAIFGAIDPDNHKMERLLVMLGFVFLNYGEGRKVFVYTGDDTCHSLQQQLAQLHQR